MLSKGHTCPALYAALAMRGFFPESALAGFRKPGSFLQGHPDMNATPGVDMSTGSLGQGFSAANGMALAGKRRNGGYRVYSILGDGELQEGQVWEAAMFAAHYGLSNHTAFVDFNHLQIDGDVREVMNPLPIDEKFAAFGCTSRPSTATISSRLKTPSSAPSATNGRASSFVRRSRARAFRIWRTPPNGTARRPTKRCTKRRAGNYMTLMCARRRRERNAERKDRHPRCVRQGAGGIG